MNRNKSNVVIFKDQRTTMVTVIKKGTPINKMKQLLEKAFSRTPKKNIRKYAGVLRTDIDPLDYQKQMRDEWP